LKPSNLLLNGNCDLKICDFGLARGIKEDADYELTEYVVTRWYRAPEVMCSCQEYDQKIDVWATGCILAEILGRKPLFPGDDYIKQMNLIFATLGTPTEADMSFISNEKALEYIRGLKKQPKIPFSKLFPNANPLGSLLLLLFFLILSKITTPFSFSSPRSVGQDADFQP
jgi:serine/threonine protein kinase